MFHWQATNSIDFKQNNIEQVVSQIYKAYLADISVLSWWKQTLEVNSVAYTKR